MALYSLQFNKDSTPSLCRDGAEILWLARVSRRVRGHASDLTVDESIALAVHIVSLLNASEGQQRRTDSPAE